VDFLHIVTPFYIFLSIKLMVDGVQRGAARMLQFMIATLSDLFLRVVLSFTLSPIFWIRGVWYSWPVGWIVGIVLSATLYLVWARKLTTEGEKTSVKAE
jgi:Na+-driven multidrug efflux pump